jgi:hypothetical protein
MLAGVLTSIAGVPMKRTALAAALASALVLGGCGGADEEDRARESISAYLVEQQEEGQMVRLDEEGADCIADGMVDGIGVDQLREYGLIDEDGEVVEDARTTEMERGDAEVMVDAVFDCTDVMATMQEELATAMGGQTPEVRECLEDALTEDLVREALVENFSGNEQESQEKLMGPLGECVVGGTDVPDS